MPYALCFMLMKNEDNNGKLVIVFNFQCLMLNSQTQIVMISKNHNH